MDRHSPSDTVQVVVKDGDDTRNLISVACAQFLVVRAMRLFLLVLWRCRPSLRMLEKMLLGDITVFVNYNLFFFFFIQY